MPKAYHALTLSFHQPAGNLEEMLSTNPWAAQERLWALDRVPRALWDYQGLAKVHLHLSGTLLETLSQPSFQERVHGIVKCGDLLWYLQNQRLFEILGSGYYHPLLPLIPEQGSVGASDAFAGGALPAHPGGLHVSGGSVATGGAKSSSARMLKLKEVRSESERGECATECET